MNKMVLYICGMLFLSACAQNVHNVDTHISENFTAEYRTYKWIPDVKKRLVPEGAEELVKKTDELLRSKGYQKALNEEPDFLMSFDISTLSNDVKVEKTTGVADYGPGISCKSGDCESTNRKVTTHDRSVSVNMLVLLELTAHDSKSKSILWNATSQVDLVMAYDADETNRLIDLVKARKLIDSAVSNMAKKVPSVKM